MQGHRVLSSCFMLGGKWSCLHIDDPRSPAIKLPPLSKCMQLTPSQIVDKVSNSLSKVSFLLSSFPIIVRIIVLATYGQKHYYVIITIMALYENISIQ